MGLRFSPGCCCNACGTGNVNCPACLGSAAPKGFKVVLANIVNNGCGACDDLNGTYFLCETQQSPSSCDWEFFLSPVVCGFTVIRLVVIASFPAGFFVGLHAGAHHADWRKSYPSGPNPDCQKSNLAIPFAPLFTTGGASAQCDFSASTCVITAL